jgi:uncharacterized membrane protein
MVGHKVARHVKEQPLMKTRADVYYAWLEGSRILNGENPYARVLKGNMRDNDKYATYFPLYYEISAFTQLLGYRDPDAWIHLWRKVFGLFYIATAIVLCLALSARLGLLYGLFAGLFWLMNRWTLPFVNGEYQEALPVFFFVVSLALFERHRPVSLLLYGVSLALKQMAIFLFPLYLIWIWHEAEGKQARRKVSEGILWIAAVPVVTALPFIFWNAKGFFYSVFFSASRVPASNLGPPGIDSYLQWQGFLGRVPMLGLMAAVYVLAAQRRIGRFVSSMLVMALFLDFNPVLFNQYVSWVVPLILLCAADFASPGGASLGPPEPAPAKYAPWHENARKDS